MRACVYSHKLSVLGLGGREGSRVTCCEGRFGDGRLDRVDWFGCRTVVRL